jgi:DNA-binding MarR family transcriptional regulator
MSVALRPLEKAGLIERICDPDDRRVMLATATEKSRELPPKIYKIWGQINQEMISGLEPDEVRIFDRLLRKVRRNLSDKVLSG